jgi:hypothetical protein
MSLFILLYCFLVKTDMSYKRLYRKRGSRAKRIIAIECKLSTLHGLSKGFWNAIDDISPTQTWIIAPVNGMYTIEKGIKLGSPFHFLERIER